LAEARRLFSQLARASAQLAAAVDVRLRRETGLALVQFEPLSVIADREACRVYDVAAELGLSSGGASKLVDRLEFRGLCHRLPNPADRRSSLLKVTPAGTAMLAIADNVIDAELNDVLGSCLSGTEVAELAALVRKLCAAVLGD
jgi:DNA-binding MarR family transcriptional regulator